MGWKIKLGGADGAVKRKIFGENSARLYNYKIADDYDKLGTDKLAKMKEDYELAGGEREQQILRLHRQAEDRLIHCRC